MTNVVIHLSIAVLIYFFFLAILQSLVPVGREDALSKARWIALTGSLFWLLHPLHVSTVLYSVQRMAQLSTLFVIAGLVLFTYYRQRWALRSPPAGEVLAAVLWLVLLLLLAVLSKENGVLLMWLVVVVEVCVFKGRWANRVQPTLRRVAQVAMIMPLLVLFYLAWAQPDWLMFGYGGRDFSLAERVMTQCRLLWHYLFWLVWPDVAAMGVHHDDIAVSTSWLQPPSTFLSLLAWLSLLAVAIALRHRLPLLLFALLFYLVGHSMESSVWPLMMVFEHRNYLSSIGLCLLFALICYRLAERNERVPAQLPGLVLALLLAVPLTTRAGAWSDELRLSQFNAVRHPHSAMSHYVHANVLLRLFQDPTPVEIDGIGRRDLLVASRYHFGEALKLDAGDMSTLITLYQLDSNFFVDLEVGSDWLPRIVSLVESGRLNRQDISALESLMRCMGARTCPGGSAAPQEILAALEQRHPGWNQVALLEQEYLRSAATPAAERVAVLEQRLHKYPNDLTLLRLALVGNVELGKDGRAYEIGRRIMALDEGRWHLSYLKSTFPDMVRLQFVSP